MEHSPQDRVRLRFRPSHPDGHSLDLPLGEEWGSEARADLTQGDMYLLEYLCWGKQLPNGPASLSARSARQKAKTSANQGRSQVVFWWAAIKVVRRRDAALGRRPADGSISPRLGHVTATSLFVRT